MLIDNPRGNYRFIPGIAPFSSGAVAAAGFEIVSAKLHPFLPLQRGYDLVERHLKSVSRPTTALCAMHLRLPKALSSQGFDQFNQPYIEKLKSWGLEVDGVNPVARTNVSPEVNPVAEPSLAGFFYTVPSTANATTFVLSGAAEVKSRPAGGREIAAAGDVSPNGMRIKTQCVLEELGKRLEQIDVGWDAATTVNLYTVHDLHAAMASVLLPALGRAAQVGVTWYYARPPVTDLEMEIDARGVRCELILS